MTDENIVTIDELFIPPMNLNQISQLPTKIKLSE